MRDADAMFSRSGHSHDGGKVSRRLDIPVSEELEEAVIALAAIAGVPRAEFARRLLERAVYGDLGMLRRVARERLTRPMLGRCACASACAFAISSAGRD